LPERWDVWLVNASSRRSRRRAAALAVGSIVFAALLAADGGASLEGCAPTTTVAGAIASPAEGTGFQSALAATFGPLVPAATVYPRDTQFPTQEFAVIPATSCDPNLVPGSIAAAPASPRGSPRLVLRVPILMYHRVMPLADLPPGGNRSLVVPPKTFAAQLGTLAAAGWHTITLADLADDLEAGLRPPARTFVITIDDGYADGYDYALPILQTYGFVATYFVVAGRIGGPGHLTVQEVWTLSKDGDEIGNHTVHHLRLTRFRGSSLVYEIDAAAATIASITGRWPETLAYPFGRTDARVEAAVQACTGMKMAVIEGAAAWETWATRFETPRWKVYPGTSPAALLAYVKNPWVPKSIAGKPPLPAASAPLSTAPPATASASPS
jgi:peptidoglycan/xylan/chitin deacetylase (PgdA/CDA1 family)